MNGPQPQPPELYEIRVEGHLDGYWTTALHGLAIEHRGADTVLHGPLPDQAALHAVLAQIRDLGLRLVSVTWLPHDSAERGS